MKITYDKDAKAAYIYLTDIEPYTGVVEHSQEITDDILIDWMKVGTVWGIELLNISGPPTIEGLK